MPSIANHHILIIGGTSGMGFAVAELALSSGCIVAVASSSAVRVKSAIERLENSFPDKKSLISGYEIDLDTPDIEAHLTTLFKTVTSNGTKLLDHVILTAGRVPDAGPLIETNIIEALSKPQLPYAAQLSIGKLAPSYLKKSYTSSITLTGGRVADKPIPNYALYSTLASGLHGLVKALALELAPIRVNLVSPGATKTEMWGEMRDVIAEKMGEKALLGKVGSAEEVAECFGYLMRNGDATGTVVRSEGGAILQ
ncbi:related to enoyl-[acyl-carrier-protein] reductase 1 [Phialocephala subalpina]|uniref:Related to enoyl-[acyl-carrier-protein] reductase 1 n=1 Tax=Phialocephala subalpina TaxID=576137 RepID=A0A1L7X0G4_9HELO|nr:related to enoyl-[acyl-carrier-protein] reductase 1 [Phialocephala subalpina]